MRTAEASGPPADSPGSIPEKEDGTNNIYNTCTVYDPEGRMVAKHRKVHLFDIDIPGRQKFKVSRPTPGGERKKVDTLNSAIG